MEAQIDKDDALKLAQLSAVNQLPTLQLSSVKVRQWRSLIGYRKQVRQSKLDPISRKQRAGLLLPGNFFAEICRVTLQIERSTQPKWTANEVIGTPSKSLLALHT